MITVRFYEELNDFLPPDRRKRDLFLPLAGRRSVKDLIESLGIPHTEVDLILINGDPSEFGRILREGDRVSVYPVFERLDIRKVTLLRPEPLRESRFVLDVHLGRLAGNLRLLGFDADYRNFRDDRELAEISAGEHRILLTRDRGLLKRKLVRWGLCIRNTEPSAQTAEVLNRLDLWEELRPFSRCSRCGGVLEPVPPEQVPALINGGTVPPGVAAWCREYSRCAGCGRLFWKGSHLAGLESRIRKIRALRRPFGEENPGE